MSDQRFLAAAQRVLDGDESTHAAAELKQVLAEDHRGDERVAELLEVLERPSAVPEEVRTVVRETIARLM